MSILTRLYEKCTGRPHEHHNSDMVHNATERLIKAAEVFSDRIKPYAESPNPLEMLINDIREQRREGNGNAGTESFS